MWALCEPCNRSFYVPFARGEEMANARCPVCASKPCAFEVRVEDDAPAHVEAEAVTLRGAAAPSV